MQNNFITKQSGEPWGKQKRLTAPAPGGIATLKLSSQYNTAWSTDLILLGECSKPQNYSLHGVQNISSIFPIKVEQEELRTPLSSI